MDRRLQLGSHDAEFTINGLLNNGDQVQNTVYLKRSCCPTACGAPGDDVWTDGFAESSAADVLAAWNAAVVATVLSQDYSTESCTWSWNEAVSVGPIHTGTVLDSSFHGGGVASTAMAAGVAKALRLQSGLAGRSYRGRLYLPAVPDIFGTTDKKDLLTSTATTAYVAAGAALLAALNTNDCVLGTGTVITWVIESFIHSHAVRLPAIGTPVAAANISTPYVDYQRRRSLGHSRHH